jgi:hypothetical protein
MTRTRFEDDDRDDSHHPPRPSNAPVVLLAVGVLVGLLVACAGGAVWVLGVQRQREVRAADERIVAAVGAERRRLAAEKEAADQVERGPAPRVVGDRPRLGRTAFEAAVRGKTRDEVARAVGRPDHTREEIHEPGPVAEKGKHGGPVAADRFDWWAYRDRVTNEATNKPYAEVRVRFGADGRVDRTEYP